MIEVVKVAKGIGQVLADTGKFQAVDYLPQANTAAQSATVVPTGGTPETYCEYQLTFDVVLAAAIGDLAGGITWLAERIDVVVNALAADPSCGGVCEGVTVASWGEFYTTSLSGGSDALAVRITLTPTNST